MDTHKKEYQPPATVPQAQVAAGVPAVLTSEQKARLIELTSTFEPLPRVVPMEYLPLIAAELSKAEMMLQPLKDSPRGMALMGAAITKLDACQKKYGDDLGEGGSNLRLEMFERLLADLPQDLIVNGLFEYAKKKADMPAPADIRTIVEGMHEYRKRVYRRRRLLNLKHNAENPPKMREEAVIAYSPASTPVRKLPTPEERIANTIAYMRENGSTEAEIKEFEESVNGRNEA